MRLFAAGVIAMGLMTATAPSAVELSAGAPAARSTGWREITIPAGTALPVVLDTAVGSDISRIEQPVRGHLSRAVRFGGVNAIAAGSAISGVVTDARRSGKVKGRAHVAMRFSTLTPRGE